MTAYPQIACGAAIFLHLRHGDWKGARNADYSVVWSCRTDGIKSSHLTISTGHFQRSITFRSVVFILQLKMWFTSCGATAHLG